MEDQRTQQTLDALADLFLTGTLPLPINATGHRGPAPAGATAVADRQIDGASDAESDASPDAARAGRASVIDELDAPAPYRLPTAKAAAPAESFDQREQPRQRTPARPACEPVEAVFMGNLPGFAGPWLTQYAHELACRDGAPVVVLHIDEQHIDVELVTDEPPAVTAPQALSTGRASGPVALMVLLRSIARSSPVARWLVHLPGALSPGTRQPALQLSRWTVLCGADDTSVRSACHLLGRLIESDEEMGPDRLIGVAVMGSDEAASRAATRELDRLAAGFTDTPIECLAWRQRMAPVQVHPLGGCPTSAAVWSELRRFFDELPDEPAIRRPPKPQPAPASRRRPEAPIETESPAQHDAATAPSPAPSTTPSPTPSAATTESSSPEPAPATANEPAPQPAQAPADTVTPQPAAAAEREAPAEHAQSPAPAAPQPQTPQPAAATDSAFDATPDATPDLSTFLTGALSLEARCPLHPQTQIVLDQAGRLHLLRRHDDKAEAQNHASLRAALVDLLETRDWVRQHAQLLQLTQRQCRFDMAAEPLLHLFAGDARTAVGLVGRLGQGLKLHLLKEVRLGDAGTWFCTELN